MLYVALLLIGATATFTHEQVPLKHPKQTELDNRLSRLKSDVAKLEKEEHNVSAKNWCDDELNRVDTINVYPLCDEILAGLKAGTSTGKDFANAFCGLINDVGIKPPVSTFIQGACDLTLGCAQHAPRSAFAWRT